MPHLESNKYNPANRLSGAAVANTAIAGGNDRKSHAARWAGSLVLLQDRLDATTIRLRDLKHRFYGYLPEVTEKVGVPEAPIDGAAAGIEQLINQLHGRMDEIESIASSLNDIA